MQTSLTASHLAYNTNINVAVHAEQVLALVIVKAKDSLSLSSDPLAPHAACFMYIDVISPFSPFNYQENAYTQKIYIHDIGSTLKTDVAGLRANAQNSYLQEL